MMDAETRSEVNVADILELLSRGDMEVQGMLPWGSNYTLLATLHCGNLAGMAVYKPRRGERPLWDFPRGTLCQREVAAYLLSELLGWAFVPPTVLRDGPYGVGSVQLFIEADEDSHLITMQREGGYDFEIERLAAFDFISNNADRKGGHCLKGADGRLWAIDHGICFHVEYKLRTVLWDYAGQPLRTDILADLQRLSEHLRDGGGAYGAFDRLLSSSEVKALRRRVDLLATSGKHPEAGPGRNVPWPPI
jgi:hypothetical protein